MSCSSCPGAQVLGHSRAPTLHHVISKALATSVSCLRLRGSAAMREEGRGAEADALGGAFRPALPGMLAHALATAGHLPEVSNAHQGCCDAQHGLPARPPMLHLGPPLHARVPQHCHTCQQIRMPRVNWRVVQAGCLMLSEESASLASYSEVSSRRACGAHAGPYLSCAAWLTG